MSLLPRESMTIRIRYLTLKLRALLDFAAAARGAAGAAEAKPKRISRQSCPQRALTQQFRSAVVNLINHVLIFMSVIKNNGYACSFCNSDSGDRGCTSQEARSKTWQNH
jgi:hypothetical protein